MTIQTVASRKRSPIRRLYVHESRLRAVIDCVLEGHLGDALTDDPVHPRVACLRLGCYAIFAGDPSDADARDLLRDIPSPLELILPRSREWNLLARSVHGESLAERPMGSGSGDLCRGDLDPALPRIGNRAALECIESDLDPPGAEAGICTR